MILIFAALVAAFAFPGAALAAVDAGTSTPAISSDQADYAPGSLVTLAGSNWAPGETVHIYVNDDQGRTWERNVDVTADATGAITDQFNLPDWFVATYAVNATGPVSGTATTTFTDGNVKYDIAPSGQTTQFVETLYEAASCAPPIKNGYPNTANGSSGGSVGVGSSQSLRIDAAALSVGGGAFQAWSGPSSTFTVIAGTNGRSICVAGFQNGNRNYVATYASPTPKQDQTITFNQPTTPAAYNSTFTVSPTATSTLAVSVAASGACSISGSTVTMTSGTGTCTLTASQSGNALFNAAPDVIRTVAASKLNQIITFGALGNKTFGDPDFAVGATASSGLAVSFSALGDCNFALDGNVHISGAGSCTITASQDGDSNYNAASAVPQSFTIAKASATLALSDLSHTYDSSPKSANVTTAPLGLSGVTVTYDGLAAAPENAGSYAVVASLTNANYTASDASGTLVIAKASQAITFGALADKTFGAAAFTPTVSASSSLAVTLDVKAGSDSDCTVSSNEVTITGAGSCTLVARQAGDGNYEAAPPVEQMFTVGKAAATLALSNLSAQYDGTAKPVTVTTAPAGLAGVSVTYAGSPTAPKNAGSYAVVASLSNDDYEATDESGTLVISKKPITVTVVDKTKVYGAADPALTYTVPADALELGDTLTGDLARAAGESVAGGPYTISQGAVTAGDNYDLTVLPGTLTISKKPITGSFSAENKVYDGNDEAAISDRSLNGAVGSDVVTLSGGTATFDDRNVGTDKVVTLTGASLAGADAGNYSLTSIGTDTADITAKPISGGFTSADKVYDGNTEAAATDRSLTGVVGTDEVNLSGGTAHFDTKDVGTDKVVTLTGASLAGADAGNYSLTSVGTDKADITAKPITGSFTSADKVYDGDDSATVLSRSLHDQISGDAVSLIGGDAQFDNKNVGTDKSVTLTGASLAGADADNYSLTSVGTDKADITAKPITGSFTSADKVYDGDDSATVLTLSLDDEISADDVSLTGGTATFANRNAGTDKIVTLTGASLAGADAGNYSLTSVGAANSDITAKPITGSFESPDKVYDGNTGAAATGRALSGTISGDDVGLVGGTADFADELVGTDKVVTLTGASLAGADAANYSLSSVDTTNADITAKPITGSFTSADKVYDGNTSAAATDRLLAGVVGTDAVSLEGGVASFADENVGTDKVVTLTGASLAGADAGNYSLTSVSTEKADITAKAITGSFKTANKVYDGNTVAAASDRSLTGVVGTDEVNLSGGTAHFDTKNVGTDKVVTLTGASLAGADAGNYSLASVGTEMASITRLSIAGSFTAGNKVYDGNVTATIATRSLSGQINGDEVNLTGGTASFANKSVGTDKVVTAIGFTLAGTDAGNYELASGPWTAAADITPKQVAGSFTAASKIFDGNNSATILTRSLTGIVGTDAVSLTGGAATFDDANVGQNKIVTGVGFTITGADSGNYTLASSTLTTTASISYVWSGFLQPINDTAHQTGLAESKFKLGQTIPAKFVIKDAAGSIVQQSGNPTFSRSGNLGSCDATAALDTITEVVAPDAGVVYNWDGSQYHYNWSTKGLTAGEYRVYANLGDGTKKYVDICLTK